MLRKLFSSCFSILFVIIFLVALILLNLNLSILNVNNYKTAFQKSDFYNQILGKGVTYFISGMNQGGKSSFGPLTEQDITTTIKKSITPQWLQIQVDKIFDQSFNKITGKSTSINIVIPISDVKKSLSDNLTSILKIKVAGLPTCTAEQLKQINSNKDQNSYNFECIPSSMSTAEIENSLLDGITGKEGLLTKLPDQYNLGEIISKGPFLDTAQRGIDIFRMVMWISLSVSIVLLLIILLMNMKYIPGMLKWITIPLLIVSISVLILGVIGYFSINSLVGGFTISLPNEFKVVIFDLIKSFSGNLFISMMSITGIIFLISVVVLIISIVLGKKFPYQEQNIKTNNIK